MNSLDVLMPIAETKLPDIKISLKMKNSRMYWQAQTSVFEGEVFSGRILVRILQIILLKLVNENNFLL
jgi:hypothetical protein